MKNPGPSSWNFSTQNGYFSPKWLTSFSVSGMGPWDFFIYPFVKDTKISETVVVGYFSDLVWGLERHVCGQDTHICKNGSVFEQDQDSTSYQDSISNSEKNQRECVYLCLFMKSSAKNCPEALTICIAELRGVCGSMSSWQGVCPKLWIWDSTAWKDTSKHIESFLMRLTNTYGFVSATAWINAHSRSYENTFAPPWRARTPIDTPQRAAACRLVRWC